LKSGVALDAKDGSGETALYIASKKGHKKLVEYLLAAGADATQTVPGAFGTIGTPLHVAVKWGHIDVVRTLLDSGVDPNLKDLDAGPPLHVALRRGKKEIAELLRSKGARPQSAKSIAQFIDSADVELGKKIAITCTICHSLTKIPEKDFPGSSLWNIVGREKASLPGFEYSDSLKALGGKWTYDDLNSLIKDPKGFVPGTKKRELRGIEADDRRAALLAYLRTLGDQPYPLP
jgi:cytochrome c